MTIAAQLLAEFNQEVATTKRVLDRVPDEHLTWRPHPTSMALGVLALHIATVPGAIARMAQVDVFDAPNFVPPEPTSRTEILAALGESSAAFREILGAMSDDQLNADWTLTAGGRELMRMPRAGLFRTVGMNHVYHHRGQLAMCLRILGIPVPSVYGPSRDENPFA